MPTQEVIEEEENDISDREGSLTPRNRNVSLNLAQPANQSQQLGSIKEEVSFRENNSSMIVEQGEGAIGSERGHKMTGEANKR